MPALRSSAAVGAGGKSSSAFSFLTGLAAQPRRSHKLACMKLLKAAYRERMASCAGGGSRTQMGLKRKRTIGISAVTGMHTGPMQMSGLRGWQAGTKVAVSSVEPAARRGDDVRRRSRS